MMTISRRDALKIGGTAALFASMSRISVRRAPQRQAPR